MRKILIPAWSFYPSQEGGPSNALYWLATGLANAGYAVRVVTTLRRIIPGQVVENQWIWLEGFEVIYSSIERYHALIEKEIEKCDVLIANGVCSIKNFRLNKRALQLGKKVILSPRGELFDAAVFHKGKMYGWLKCAMFRLMKRVYGELVLYHATSLEEVEAIKKYMGRNTRISLISNYLILSNKVVVAEPAEPYLLYVGRLNHIKNIHIILEGLALSAEFMSKSLKFKLAGEKAGKYYESLVAQARDLGIADRVEFIGLVTGDEKDRLYAGAKCLLLMSKSENFGNVIVEALSQGTPVIASQGTPWQKLNEKGAGWWIPPEPEVVADTVDLLVSLDVHSYQTMRENAYAFSMEFDIFTNMDKWREIIELR